MYDFTEGEESLVPNEEDKPRGALEILDKRKVLQKFPTSAAALAEQRKGPPTFVLTEKPDRFAKYSPAFSTIFGHSYIEEHHKGATSLAAHLRQHLLYVEAYDTHLGGSEEVSDFKLYGLENLERPMFSNRDHSEPIADFRFQACANTQERRLLERTHIVVLISRNFHAHISIKSTSKIQSGLAQGLAARFAGGLGAQASRLAPK